MIARVSVIIPLYNKESYVTRALDSIASQDYSDFEVIVVDDGSTDRGAALVESYQRRPVRVIKQSNAGPGAARNRALAEAQGEFVAFLDADDEWGPNYLSEGVRLLNTNEDAMSVTFGYFIHPKGESSEKMWRGRGITEGIHQLSSEESPALAVHMLAYMSPCTTIARTETIRRWGGFYSADRCLYAEDAHLWLKVLLNEKVAFSLKPLVHVHSEASGLTRNLKTARPIEPFLQYPDEIRKACPPHLLKLLDRILAIRAFKTACVLGFWGHWREANQFVRRFNVPSAWRLPYYAPALVCRTPVGAALGAIARKFFVRT